MTDRATQRRIISELEVVQGFDASHEAERRVRFLAEYLAHTRTGGLVLGISGGVDSSVGGRLCRLACEKVRADGGVATFVAMRLPYGVQALVEKVPTADLEDDKPLIPDEVVLGVRYAAVDDYLEGKDIDAADEETILRWYRRTAHKRALPVTPAGWEARQAG